MPDYDSPFFITNDRADLVQSEIEDGTAVVWPLSADAQLVRSPDRQYCGNYVTYGDNGAATYRHNDATHALIAAGPNQHRDMTSSFPLVKTLAKAQARGDRQLLDVHDQDVRITTRLENIPATRVTLAKAGMRLQIKGTHWGPTCDDWHYARIVTAQPKPHSDGSLYDIDLELVMGMPIASSLSPGPPADDFSGDAFAGLQRTNAYASVGYLPAFAGTYNTGENFVGWGVQDESGPLHIVEGSAPWLSIVTSAAITVRIHARGEGAGVYLPTGVNRTLSVTVNGVVVGTDSRSTLTGFDAWSREVDIHDYHLDAGDVVSVTGTMTDEWGNLAVNHTFLLVGRGTYLGVTTPGDPTPPGWSGP